MSLLELLEKQHCTYICLTLTDDSRFDDSWKENMKKLKERTSNCMWSTVIGSADPQSLNCMVDRVIDYVRKLSDVARNQSCQDRNRISLFPWL